MTESAWSKHWRVRYPNGEVAPAMSQEQAKRVARNVGGEALPPDEAAESATPTYEWGVRIEDHRADDSLVIPYDSEKSARDAARGAGRTLVRRMITQWEETA